MTSHKTSAETWHPVLAELDRWSAAGRQVKLWLRDDDAIEPSPALDRLADLGTRFDLAILLAVIPLQAQPSLGIRLRGEDALVPCQHGCAHRNHAPAGEKKAEFGLHRPCETIATEIALARDRLGDLLGAVLPVFVPPWNRIAPPVAAMLPDLGFAALSCFRDFALGGENGPALVNTQIDIIDWHGGRIGRQAAPLAAEIAAQLALVRVRGEGDTTFGILLHHRDHDETAWRGLVELLTLGQAHPAVALSDPRRIFAYGTGLRDGLG